mgnify:CR=1 FL=1
MNTFLSYLAGFIALLLVAALAGPTFVDWNQFRGEFEAQAQKITGREVTIGGDISFVVLPAPHLTLNNVSVANVEGSENPDFLRVGQVDVEVALAPLLSGQISATSVKIARPLIHLEVGPDGANNWRDLVSLSLLRENGFFAPSSVSLEKVSFEEGAVTFRDRRADRNWRVDHVNGDVTATSLLGPMRAEMSLSVNGIPFAVRAGLGNFSGKKAVKITTEIQSLNAPAKLLFSGISTSLSSNARVDGTASLELGSTKVVDGETPLAPLRIEAGIVSNGDTATLRNLIVAMAGTTLKGDAQASWRGRPSFDFTLAGEALTLDPLLDRLGEFADSGSVPLGGLANLPVPGWIDAKADIKVDGLLSRDVLIKNAALNLDLTNGKLYLRNLRGSVAGNTVVSMRGALVPDDVPHFDGKISATSDNLSALSLWLESLRKEPGVTKVGEVTNAVSVELKPADTKAEPIDTTARAFAVTSTLRLTPDILAFSDIRAAYSKSTEAPTLTGSTALSSSGDRVLVTSDLAATNFDLDPLRALWPVDTGPAYLLAAYDFNVKATAARLKFDQKTITGLEVVASTVEGKLGLERFHADALAGARVVLSGVLSGVAEMRLDALRGTMKGTVVSEDAGDFFALFGFGKSGFAGPADLGVDFASGKAVDSEAALDTLTVKGTLGESRVDAVMKRAQVSGDGADTINLIANASNAQGRALLKQLGYAANERLLGAGSASLQMSGPMDKPYDIALRVNVGEGTFTAKGKLRDPMGARVFDGQADVSASGVETVLAAVGVPDYLGDFIVAQAAGPSFVASAKLSNTSDAMLVNSLEIVTGNLHVAGDISLAKGHSGQVPVISGSVESNILDLTPVFAEDAEATSPWSAAALDLSPMSQLGGELDVKVGQVRIGTLRLEAAAMHLVLADDVLSVTPLTAKMADGAVSATARIEGGKSGVPGIGLTYKLDDADFAKLGPQVIGARFATGRVSLDLQAEAQGRSWLGMVSSINGVGKVSTNNARFAPLNLPAYVAVLKDAAAVGDLPGLSGKVLQSGETKVDGLDGDISFKDGLGRLTRDGLVLDGGKATLSAMIDVPRLSVDSEMRVAINDPADAPGYSDSAAGKIGEISRRVDTQALQQYASRRILAKSIEDAGIKNIPGALKDLMGLSDSISKGPSVAGVPLPMQKPDAPRSSLQ